MALGSSLATKTPAEIAFMRITKAKQDLFERQKFFGYLIYYLNPVEVKNPKFVHTMAVDYNNLYYYTPFVNRLSPEELVGVLMHVIQHVVYHHPGKERMGDRNPKDWNVACDYVINLKTIDNGFILPSGALLDISYKDNMTAEAVYTLLLQKKQNSKDIKQKLEEAESKRASGDYEENTDDSEASDNNGDTSTVKGSKKGDDSSPSSDPNPSPSIGNNPNNADSTTEKGDDGHYSDGRPVWVDDHINDDSPDNKEGIDQELTDQRWKARIAEAYQAAKAQGSVPAEIERCINELVEDSIPWKQVLQKWISQNNLKADYSWDRPNRRWLSYDLYLPGFKFETIKGVIGLDTSGSMGYKELSDCVSEVRGVTSVASSYELYLIPCDAQVNEAYNTVITEVNSEIPDSFGGGGRTDFRPVFNYVQKNQITPDFMIYFTDGFGNFPTEAPTYPVLWCVTENGAPENAFPFGQVLRMKKDKKAA